jgi:hypothetical protein
VNDTKRPQARTFARLTGRRTLSKLGAMKWGLGSVLGMLLLMPQMASAQLQPHRAEYVVRFGTAANAPRVGRVLQDITLDCQGWHIQRDFTSEIALTPSMKVSLAAKLEGEERRDGEGFLYRTALNANGDQQDTSGKVLWSNGEFRADIESSKGPSHIVLPPPTLMPVAAVQFLVERLKANVAAFPAFLFAAEAMGDTFRIDVKELGAKALKPPPPAVKPVAVPDAQFWPVSMTFTRLGSDTKDPLFSMSAKIYNSGVLDRMTVDAGIVSVMADLQTLEMHQAPTCPGR